MHAWLRYSIFIKKLLQYFSTKPLKPKLTRTYYLDTDRRYYSLSKMWRVMVPLLEFCELTVDAILELSAKYKSMLAYLFISFFCRFFSLRLGLISVWLSNYLWTPIGVFSSLYISYSFLCFVYQQLQSMFLVLK